MVRLLKEHQLNDKHLHLEFEQAGDGVEIILTNAARTHSYLVGFFDNVGVTFMKNTKQQVLEDGFVWPFENNAPHSSSPVDVYWDDDKNTRMA